MGGVDTVGDRARLKSLSSALLLAASLGPSASTSAQTLRDAAYKTASAPGLDRTFRLEHDDAIQFFLELENDYPSHPGPPLARAISIWLRELVRRDDLDLERFLTPGYFTGPSDEEMAPAERRAFFDAVSDAQDKARAHLREHPGDHEARYYLGSAEGALGVFAFTIERKYRKALKHGKESYRIQRKIVDEDPDFVDAYVALGSYEYVVGNLPWYIKWLATLAGYRGTEARGFEYLVRAAKEGYMVQRDARVLLMVMYVREREYEYALEMAQQLHQIYPENYLLHLNQAQILERMGESELAASTYVAVTERAALGTPNYQKLPLEKIRYPIGERLLSLGSEERALGQFRAAAADPNTSERERALANLRAGEILDGTGRHDEAEEYFRRVQTLEDVDGSHTRAERYLRDEERR